LGVKTTFAIDCAPLDGWYRDRVESCPAAMRACCGYPRLFWGLLLDKTRSALRHAGTRYHHPPDYAAAAGLAC
jgi:hypothetical protein